MGLSTGSSIGAYLQVYFVCAGVSLNILIFMSVLYNRVQCIDKEVYYYDKPLIICKIPHTLGWNQKIKEKKVKQKTS